MFGRDPPRAQDERARGPIDDRIGNAWGGDDDQIGDRAGAELSARAAERFVRFAGRQRESLLQLAVREQGMALSDDRGAVEHVAIAIRRPAVANVVGAGEQRHAALAEPADRRHGRGWGARRHDRDFRAGERVGGLREQVWPDGSERERVADRDAALHARRDRPIGDVAQLGGPGLAAVMEMNVDSLAEALGETEDDVELAFDVAVEARGSSPPMRSAPARSAAAIRSGAPFSVVTPLCGKATS